MRVDIDRLLESFTSSLDAFRTALDKHSKAIAEYDKVAKSEEQQEQPPIVVSEFKLPVEITEYYRAKQQAQPSKALRRTKNVIEIGAVLIALGLLIVNIFQMSATQKAVSAAKNAADISAVQLELAQRPWIYTDVEITKPLVFNDKGLELEIKTSTRNDGNSPAIGVNVRSEIYIPKVKHTATDERSRFCGESTTRSAPWGQINGSALIPKQKPEEQFATLEAKIEGIRDVAISGRFAAAIIVCTIYESTFGKPGPVSFPYFSNTAYRLFQVLPSNNAIPTFKIGENVPNKNLAIVPWLGGTGIR